MQQIGRYQVLGELGKGAMGVVYKAQDPAIGRTIAIKTIRLSDLTEPAERDRLRDRLFREAQSAGILSHPNIVTIYDILEQDGMAYIFMEFVNGPPLEKVLAAEETPAKDRLLDYLRQTAAALDYAHKKGIVHRDIKPANVMIHDDGAAKITDFGVAKIVSQQMTQAGTMMGTPSYMSPEQVQGGSVDGRADQFALGVMAYEMLTGEKPFAGEYLPTLLYKICREDPASVQQMNPTLGQEVDTVLRRALAKTPDERYPTCSDFVADLERTLATMARWQPLPRGMSGNMETLAATRDTASREAVPIAVAAPAAAATPAVSVASSTQDGLAAEPRIPARLEDTESHTIRNVVVAAVAVLVVGLIFLIAQKWNQKTETPADTASAQQPAQTPEKPSTTKTASAAAQKPLLPPPPPETVKPEPAQPPTPQFEKPSPVKPQGATGSLPPTTPGAAKPGRETPVQFSSSPAGASIIADNNPELACKAPCSLDLPVGRHVVTASLDGYRKAQKILETPRDTTIPIDLEQMIGALNIKTNPPGATILLNGTPRPEKTPALLKLPVGSYRLQVKSGAASTDEETVQVKDGGIRTVEYSFQ